MTKDVSSKTENQQSEETPSVARRNFLINTASLVAGAGIVASGIQTAQAMQKADKGAVNYQDTPNGDKRCSDCRFFDGGSGCQVVDGDISPDGWCTAFISG